MNKGTFYSVGVGPGDPMLLTLKAVEIIKQCDIIAAPASGGAQNIALTITKDYLANKKIVECDMPMTRDKDKLEQSHQSATEQMEAFLNDGKSVAFLTLGDPSIYSTAIYLHKRLCKSGYKTVLIPGVPSFCAVAASLNTSLCEGSEPLHIIPASYNDTEQALTLRGNKVLMKSGKSISTLRDRLICDKSKVSMMVECASMENEKVHNTLGTVSDEASYFSIIVIKEDGGQK